MARTPRETHLHLELPDTAAPLRHRVASAIVAAVRTGTLGPGDPLPASRALARDLGIARAAVVDAYDELAAAGYAVARPGSGTRVAAGADAAARAGLSPHVTAAHISAAPASPPHHDGATDLSPGYPDTGLISERDWRQAWRTAASLPIPHVSPGPAGHRQLREALSIHLRRTRGIAADPDEIVIVPGVPSALRALVAAADLAGRDAAFEDPGYGKARRALSSAGMRIRPVAVDRDGLDPELLRTSDSTVYCTPAHQYPMGARMPVARRAALVSASVAAGRLVIEDDYDGEFRYGVSTLPALRAIDRGRECVAYVGTASKILSPALRLAWLIPPVALLEPVRHALDSSGESVCAITACALADFIESGSLTRHLARAARTYAARRHAFVDALRRHLPDVELTGVDAGLHVVVRLPDFLDDAVVAAELGRRGVTVPGLSGYRTAAAVPSGLLCGYARLPETHADAAAQTIADVIRERRAAVADNSGSCTTTGS
ncbi:PLP-dependent aminotransferase family protein [Rhodococcus sp. ABRD24]|nr:PLP-dependent aminotransferase family protein [Rhodococcus sp. ABRD24]